MKSHWLLKLLRPLFLSVISVVAHASTVLNSGFSVRLWQTENGLPQNMVTGSVQTSAGHIMLSTYSGLARFDGEAFHVLHSTSEPSLPDRRVSAIFEAHDQVLWIGHESGAVSSLSQGELRVVHPPSGALGDKIIGIGSDERGLMWAMKEKGTLISLNGGSDVPSLIQGHAPSVMNWSRGADGKIWVSENGRAAYLGPDGLKEVTIESPTNENFVLTLAGSKDGGAWILCDGQIRKWKDGAWVENRGRFPWPTSPLSCARELEDGTLAVGTTHSGLYFIYANNRPPTAFNTEFGMPQNWVRFINQDREGGIWVGLGTSGVARIQASPFTRLNAPDRWQGCTVLAVQPGPDRSLWIGTDGAGLYHYSQYGWKRYGGEEGLYNAYVPAIGLTQRGSVYVGNFWPGSPYRLNHNQFVRDSMISTDSSAVFALVAGSAPDEILVGTREGLLRVDQSGAERIVVPPSDQAGPVCAIAHDASGPIWIGFEEGGLARIVNGQVEFFRMGRELPTDSIRSLWLESDGTLWIGTADRGIVRYRDGSFSTIGTERGILDDYVGKIIEDDMGYLWLATHHGLQRVKKDELHACAEKPAKQIESQIYNHHDGLPTIEFTGGLQSAACRDREGRLWFATPKGLVAVDPKSVRSNPNPPPVILESMIVDGASIPTNSTTEELRLKANFERVEFKFSGLSFAAPEKVRFRYRLEGIDREWVDSSTRRFASYSRLPAGEYTFRVIACNNDNVWNLTGASITFSVLPFFWNTWWFALVCLCFTGIAAAWTALRVAKNRAQRRIEKILKEHAVELERKRIAQDIHDDIGSILSQIAMLSQPAASDLSSPRTASAVLERIYSMAKEMTRSLDEIVWAVDPRHDSLEGLLVYMGKHAQSFLSDVRIRCRLHLPVELPPFVVTAEMRHSLFLAFKEVLNNAAKHADASEVRISFYQKERLFFLEVKDDGKGFDPEFLATVRNQPGQPGNGLTNLSQRLERIGGRVHIESKVGAGTTVRFTFPLQSTTHDPSSSIPKATV